MNSSLFVVLPSGCVKKTTIQFPIERLVEFGAQLKAHNPRCKVYIKDSTGRMQEIE